MTGMLHGLKVADLSIVTAGAAATQVLADFGADVVKIESAARPDLYRGGFTGDQGSADDLSFPPFRVANRGKRGLSVDLKRPEGLEIARRLIAQSDVVVENFRRGAVERLGLGFSDLVAIRPDIVLVSISSQGATGPNCGYSSFGTTLDALSGIQSLSGYDASTPTWSSGRINYPDQTASSLSPAVIIAAVMAARADGRARWVDLSQRETVTSLLGEYVLATSLGGADPVPLGNSAPGEPGWLSPCAGQDRWVALALTAASDWGALAAIVGTDLADGDGDGDELSLERLRVATDRWTATRTREEAAAELRSAGLAAAPVTSGEELLDDPYLRESGWWQPVDAPDGTVEQQRGWVVQFEEDGPERVHRRAPHVGEDTDIVLGELGYSAVQITELYDTGVVTAPVRFPAEL
jgi:crotonobetainyl-CoA:carnitine CoA-transferase CaiB-like acyl-CoA transferase